MKETTANAAGTGLRQDAGRTVITALGNAGFLIDHDRTHIIIDPLFLDIPGSNPNALPADGAATIILVTHDHWDHFNPRGIANMVESTAAVVVGPQSVVGKLSGRIPASSLIELEPTGDTVGAATQIGKATITAYRTFHSRGHNSYLIELPGLRLFHDGDNERTQTLDRSVLANLDALMICPWQGSGCVEFIESIKPRLWFLMHMTEEELDQHDRGEFFTGLCDHVSAGLVVLRPGDSSRI